MLEQDFIIELGTEELPPKVLKSLSTAFEQELTDLLKVYELKFCSSKIFATPRRLAVLVKALVECQNDQINEKIGPSIDSASDQNGNPTPAAIGFAKSCGVQIEELKTIKKDNKTKLYFSAKVQGKRTSEILPDLVKTAINKLPIPKKMRWGSSREEFIRPVHWVMAVYGNNIIDIEIFGVKSGNQTFGHRFHTNESITITAPEKYEKTLEKNGYVVASFEKRRKKIKNLIEEAASNVNSVAIIDPSLLEEVTGLVEWPVALTGNFDEHFLKLPAQCLILSLQSHQKTFCCNDVNGNLLPIFIAISNLESKNPIEVVKGNERVIRPRLADAEFFFDTDRKIKLDSRLENLKAVIFQKDLGTLYNRSARIAEVSGHLASRLGIQPETASRAGLLSKCDLVSNMVGEFADLQGIMGKYYAESDGESSDVANAIQEQYLPRFSGDELPQTEIGCVVSIAEKMDTITGLFSVGQPPTGSKDPFALRRAAIGLLRIIIERDLDLDLCDCIEIASKSFFKESEINVTENQKEEIFEFLLDRLQAIYLAEGVTPEVFSSVRAIKPTKPADFDRRIKAVAVFARVDDSRALSDANKRVLNILSKNLITSEQISVNEDLLVEDAEIKLLRSLEEIKGTIGPMLLESNYSLALQSLGELRRDIDEFFTDVLVNCEEKEIRENRMAILWQLRSLFSTVADISLMHGN